MSQRSSTSTPPLLQWMQDWAQLDRRTMGGIERALHDGGLLSVGCDRTEDAVWLLLTLCTGLPASAAVHEALRIAELVNVEQKVNGQPFRSGDHGIDLVGGLLDIVNVQRGRPLVADFVLTGCRGHWFAALTTTIEVSATNPVFDLPAGALAALSFEFGDVVSGAAGAGLLRRNAFVSHPAFVGLAGVLGPLPEDHEVALDLFWPVQTPTAKPATLH
jgi:hypothetical protein